MCSSKPPLFLIAGPTASGKSALALALAEQIHGVIVNADSAQIYQDIPILSAAPGADELNRAEHRLYGLTDGAHSCSAQDWALLAAGAIKDIHSQGRVPILVGGTGLYIRTLLEGIAPVPAIAEDIRATIRSTPLAENFAKLALLDPAASERLRPSDTARINRALEVIVSTGKPLVEWQKERIGGIRSSVLLCPVVLQPPREWLYARCNERFSSMVRGGAVNEVKALLARKLDPALPVMRAIGVPELRSYLEGRWTIDQAIEAGQQSTRRYAKRQYTWFAHQAPPEWPRLVEPLDQSSADRALALARSHV